ncbi:hypothetical protein GGS23DRAFT_113612 [Durotheca rogersii]|uniref:uncharacterized protein n=1 Tax=Durotheca rogersii TaxID=419775 RepID=UPI0022208121|nr:uncharacterized protein GGS23DRAFT_113612 [Durotheca rogersii]KAI5862244.1 hypothetical protein GGS23DRAFT_113612 [Durotheca rogersii]
MCVLPSRFPVDGGLTLHTRTLAATDLQSETLRAERERARERERGREGVSDCERRTEGILGLLQAWPGVSQWAHSHRSRAGADDGESLRGLERRHHLPEPVGRWPSANIARPDSIIAIHRAMAIRLRTCLPTITTRALREGHERSDARDLPAAPTTQLTYVEWHALARPLNLCRATTTIADLLTALSIRSLRRGGGAVTRIAGIHTTYSLSVGGLRMYIRRYLCLGEEGSPTVDTALPSDGARISGCLLVSRL